MLRKTLRTGLFVLGLFTYNMSAAQQAPQQTPEDSFASENAVLDTSILFAIGAREARQELRGAFGWPTFQEGLVDGVYFRFDPDGYARFAPTPRLDSDVFEVICRPRTLVCMGRKDTLQVTLNNRGQVQLEMSNIAENDEFIMSDGISELPLPPTILQPLEPRMELLLSSGGDLVVRRNGAEAHRLSLEGFGAVIPYLRWVAARQDYTVLPRGWPVPNSLMSDESASLTQTTLWPSPMPQPNLAPQAAPAGVVPTNSVDPQIGADVAEVRGELNILRQLLLDNQPQSAAVTAEPAMAQAVSPQGTGLDEDLETRISDLMKMTEHLQEQLDALQTGHAPQPTLGVVPAENAENTRDVARHLEYLMS